MKILLKRFIVGAAVCVMASAALFGCATRHAGDDALRLTILHTNDTHANWGGHTKDGRICYEPLCEDGTGGTVRLSRAVDAIRASEPATLLLDAGDQFQGTLYFTKYKEQMPAEVLNALGYDAFVPGNHEFDDGCARFEAFVRALKTPVVAANLSLGDKSSPFAPWVVISREGRNIGIVGLVNPQTPVLSTPCAEAVFAEPESALRKALAELEERGVNVVILLTHLGLSDDRALARSVNGVDVIVGGHTHSLLSNTEENAVGPYPVVERSPEGSPVLVVTSGYAGLRVGRIDVTFDSRGIAQSWAGAPILLTDAALAEMKAPVADKALVGTMQARSEEVQKLLTTPVGRIVSDVADGKPLESPDVLQCRQVECRSGNLVAEAFLDAGKAEIALVNGGGVRNSFPAGAVSSGDVIQSLPFENRLVTGTIDGATLMAALENGLARYEEVKGMFLQVAGLRYVFNPSNPKGKRLVSASVRDASGKWKKLRPGMKFRVATLSYLAEGGDGYSMLKKISWKDSERNASDVVRDFVASKSPVSVRLDGRIVKR